MNLDEALDALEAGELAGIVQAAQGFSDEERFRLADTAVSLEQTGLLRDLLEAGLDPRVGSFSDTLLKTAASEGNVNAASVLLEYGADPNQGIPLVVAVMRGHDEVVRLLLDAGADPNQGNPGFPTALGFAKQFRHVEVAALLEARGATRLVGEGTLGEPKPASAGELPRVALGRILGEPSRTMVVHEDPRLDVQVILGEDSVILHSVGASTKGSGDGPRGAELVLRLPRDWDLDQALDPDGDLRWRWPMDELVRLARGAQNGAVLTEGDTVADPAGPAPFGRGTALGAWLLVPATDPVGDRCTFQSPEGRTIHVLGMLPLHPSELALKMEQGVRPLMEALGWDRISLIVDPDRDAVVPGKKP